MEGDEVPFVLVGGDEDRPADIAAELVRKHGPDLARACIEHPELFVGVFGLLALYKHRRKLGGLVRRGGSDIGGE